MGGAVLFFGWIAALSYGFWLSSEARTRARRFGIVVGRRMVEVPASEAATPDSPRAGQPSSR